MADPRNRYEAWHAELNELAERADALHRDAPCCPDASCPLCAKLEQAALLLAEAEREARAGIDQRNGCGREARAS